jgi:hypothetical protein
MKSKTLFTSIIVCALAAVSCSTTPHTPLSPSAAGPSTSFLNPDGSNMKVGEPFDLEPNGGILDTRRPTLRFTNPAGRFVQMDFAYDIEVQDENGNIAYERTIGSTPQTSSHTLDRELNASTTYWWRARVHLADDVGPWSGFAEFRTPSDGAPSGPTLPIRGSGPRTPDPPPGQRLPLPHMAHIVQQVANQFPGPLFHSCQEEGGSWDFMDILVDTLRTFDNRWGYNWKRGNIGDPSHDVVDYHHGPGPSEGSIAVYIIDVIGGHCGSNPTAAWGDVTDVTYSNGAVGRWTGLGRFTN